MQNNRYNRLPIGSRLSLRIKSSKSCILDPAPNGWKLLQILNPNTHGNDKMITTATFHATAFFTEQPVRSVAKEIIFWNTAITVERAAKDINTNNNDHHSSPPAIWLNTFGRVIKIRDGPEVGSTP